MAKLVTVKVPGRVSEAHSKVHERVAGSLGRIIARTRARGGRLYFTDLFRPWQDQAELKIRKPRLAATPGSSYHEAGLAFDFSTYRLGIPLETFYDICRQEGWTPIRSEPWHIQHVLAPLGYATIEEAIKDVGNWRPGNWKKLYVG